MLSDVLDPLSDQKNESLHGIYLPEIIFRVAAWKKAEPGQEPDGLQSRKKLGNLHYVARGH